MGTENTKRNQAKERRRERKEARKTLKNGRNSETKKSLERVLIVSEGIKTEPTYFNKLVDYLKLVPTDIEVTGAKHSCPKKVVEYAIELYEKSLNTPQEYDLVFCVIDKDSHAHYSDALDKIDRYKTQGVLYAINSVPCFELWLLLHFAYTTKPFSKTMNRSICQALIKDELKKYLPNYEKNISNLKKNELASIYNDTTIVSAIKRAEQLIIHCSSAETDNPSTKIHELVLKLQEIKNRPFRDV
jgi:hypothetical protein